MRPGVLVGGVLLLSGCRTDSKPLTVGDTAATGVSDTDPPDTDSAPHTGEADTGEAPDSGDTGATDTDDSGAPDSGAPDSGAPDSGARDSGERDVGELGELVATFIGDDPTTYAGFRVADVPGGETSGIAIGAPLASGTYSTGGAVFVFSDPTATAEAYTSEASLTITPAGPRRYLGQGVAACATDAGPHLIVGAPSSGGGSVFVFDLPASGIRSTDSARLTYASLGGEDQLGGALACSPNADWFAAGAAYTSDVETRAGAVLLFETGMSGTYFEDMAIARIEGDALGQTLGSTLSMGDVNGDGLTDLIAGGSGEGGTEPFASAAGLFLGPISGDYTLDDADIRWDGLAAADRLGSAVATGEDMNGDGYDDIAIAAYWESTIADRNGAVFVLVGGTTGPDGLGGAAAIIRGAHEYAYAGISIDWLSDADGDGRADLAIGEYARREGGAMSGLPVGGAHVFLGPVTGSAGTDEADLTVEGDSVYGAFGYAVAGASDADGDGLSDLIVGAYQMDSYAGRVFLFSGGRP